MEKEKLLRYYNELLINMRDKENIQNIIEYVDLPHFYLKELEAHKAIFHGMIDLWKDNKTINKMMVDTYSTRYYKGDYNNLETFIEFIFESDFSIDIQNCIDIITTEYKIKESKRIANNLNHYINNTTNINFLTINSFTEQLQEIVQVNVENDYSQDLETAFDEVELLRFKESEFLREKMIGLMRKNIQVVAAEESHGKTTMIIFIINELLRCNHKVLFFAVEPTYIEVLQKLVSLRTKIDSNLLIEQQSDLKPIQKEKAKKELKFIKDKYLDTKQLIILDKITDFNEMKLWIRKEKPDVFIIDPIQAIEMPRLDNKEQSVAFGMPTIMQRMKNIAKTMNSAALITAWVSSGKNRPEIQQMYATKAITKWSTKTWLLWIPQNGLNYKIVQNMFELIEGKQRNAKKQRMIGKLKIEYGIFERTTMSPQEKKTYEVATKRRGDL